VKVVLRFLFLVLLLISITQVSFSYGRIYDQYQIYKNKSTLTSTVGNQSTDTIKRNSGKVVMDESQYVHYTNKMSVWTFIMIASGIGCIIFSGVNLKTQKPPKTNNNQNKSDDTFQLKEECNLTFDDIGGLEEVKEELKEIIDFIKNREEYEKMDAKIPKGVILYGPPGTGKTLIAKVVASESGCSFFTASGAEFVEKYVGVGAQRVRELFKKAKEKAPSIIFIDEIDAVAVERGDGNNGEKDQTLNQLLVEMDGMGTNNNVVVIAATNRIDMLDNAILRPGRFGIHIYVGVPNLAERIHILKVHTRGKKLSEDVDLHQLARKTAGLSGASLAQIANEAAIHVVRNKRQIIEACDFQYAFEKIVTGLRKKNAVISSRERQVIAYHEAGHAFVAKYLNIDKVEKISIIPTGQALGYVLQTPDEEKYLLTKNELISKIEVILGGRACEELIFGEVTTGAANDLQKATEIAIKMVCEYGMGRNIFYKLSQKYGNLDSKTLNEETMKIINESYEKVKQIIESNRGKIDKIAEILLEKEEIDGDEIEAVLGI
jgi:cell division protease FtsH